MVDGRIRILALVPDAFGGYGGIALYLSDLLQAAASYTGVKEVLILARNPLPVSVVLPPKAINLNSSPGKRGWVSALLKLLARDRNFDLIICGHVNFLPIARLAKSLTSAKLFTMIYGIDAWNPPVNRFVRWALRGKPVVVSISDHTREKFCQWSGYFKEEIQVVPNAIHLDRYAVALPDPELLARYGIEGKRVLLTLGRLNAQEQYKGIDEILKVLPDLLQDYPDLVYVVAGEGSDRERLEASTRQLGLEAVVRFTGRVADEEKARHFQLADVFAMPGRGEGFGFVFLEAMACGIPVVASVLDGSREAVRGGEIGLVTDPDDRQALKNSLALALGMPKQIPEGLEYFSFENFTQRLKAIFNGMGFSQA